MVEIKLTQGQVALIDDEDYELISQHKWCAYKHRKMFYASRSCYINGLKTVIRMHRLIMNAPDGTQVDHINGNGLDNRKENLRLVSNHQNQWNRHSISGKSKYKGIHWNKQSKKWQSQIKVYGKRIHLGYFREEIDAAVAYDKAAIKYFGEFAKPNFIERGLN